MISGGKKVPCVMLELAIDALKVHLFEDFPVFPTSIFNQKQTFPEQNNKKEVKRMIYKNYSCSFAAKMVD